jgi:DNA-binding NtrC family response regulator
LQFGTNQKKEEVEPLKVFIVEDDVITAKVLAESLHKEGNYSVEVFTNGKDFLDNLYKSPDVISLDYLLPDYNGLDIFKKIRKFNPAIPVIIVSGQQDIATALEILRKGAYDYVVKDRNMKGRLTNLINKIEQNRQLQLKITQLEEEVGKKYLDYNPIKGTSPAIQRIFELVEKASKTNIAVSISGETGTGKELVAKAIHYNSLKKKGKFVAINVSAVPQELIESELFGHEKGSFTGANNRRVGKFEEADGGTLFLDEVADMDLNMQVKLLRALQEEEFTRVGSNQVIKFDARIIVATNKNLTQEVKNGAFRKDLYFRLLGLPIELPPLRTRGNDVLLLSRYFMDEFCMKNGLKAKTISPKTQEKLLKYAFPGNVRELKALIELACVMSGDNVIEPEDITFTASATAEDFLSEERTLEEYDLRIVKHFLEKYDGNIKIIAEKLGIGKTTIYRMVKKDPTLANLTK